MNLDEAIKHALRVSVECKDTGCGYDHYQLAKWLAELRSYRKLADEFSAFLRRGGVNRDNFTKEESQLIHRNE